MNSVQKIGAIAGLGLLTVKAAKDLQLDMNIKR